MSEKILFEDEYAKLIDCGGWIGLQKTEGKHQLTPFTKEKYLEKFAIQLIKGLEQRDLILKDIADSLKGGHFDTKDIMKRIKEVCNYEGLQERIH